MFLLIASVLCQVEPVGRWFEAFIKRRNINVSSSFQELEDEKELSEESGDEELQLEEFPMLKTLDPKDWKVFSLYRLMLIIFAGRLLSELSTMPSCQRSPPSSPPTPSELLFVP